MTMLYPIVLETEDDGAVSAYVPGLPVYAAADSHAKAERAIRSVLAEYLKAHPASRPEARVRVARVSDGDTTSISVVGVAALVGAKRSDAKARASRASYLRRESPVHDQIVQITRLALVRKTP